MSVKRSATKAQPKRRRGKTEAELSLEIRKWLQLHGWRVHRLTADQRPGAWQKRHEREEPGTPDYVCVRMFTSIEEDLMPVLFYWEAKREKGGKIRPAQRAWIDDARKRGYLVLEAPNSVEAVNEWLLQEGLA